MKKYQDFIPKADGDRVTWLKNYLKLVREAVVETGVFMEDAEINIHEQEVQEYIDAIIDSEQKKNASKAATSLKEELDKTTIKKIRKMSRRIKAYDKEQRMTARMDIKCKGNIVNEAELRPDIKVVLAGTKIHVHFNKNHHYNVAVYCRKPGEDFEHIGYEITSPFVDERPLAIPFQPERREYMVMYTNLKETIGQQSNIAGVLYGG
jgi:hypothetical protein